MFTSAPMTVLLVPGLWHGAWAWEKVERLLEERGIPYRSVTFPGRDRQAGDGTFRGHCEHFRREVEAVEGPVVAVAHSYAGAVVTEAADPSRVEALVFLAAFPLNPGESIADVMDGGGESDGAVTSDSIGQSGADLEVDRDTAVSGFYQDCDPDEAETAFTRLTPEHPSTRTTKVTTASWRSIPSHYVMCTYDRAIPIAWQRELAERVDSTSEIASGHCPMLSQPVELTDTIERIARGG